MKPRGEHGRRLVLPVLVSLGVLAGFLPAAGQTLTGRVLDEGTERPVGGAIVSLVDREGETREETVSDGEGRFRLVPPEAGQYVLATSAYGYESARSPLFELGLDGTARIELMVRAAPVGLEGLEVEVEREAELFLRNFGVAPATLSNRWIGRDEIDDMETPGLVKDVIRWQNIGGVSIDEYDASQNAPLCVRFMRRTRQCAITVVDGIVVPPESAFGVVATDVEAIAVLDPVEATTFYGTAGGGGAVMIWTRAGGGR